MKISKIAMGCALLRARLTGRRFPFLVNWAITGRCNLRCRHCYGLYGVGQTAELPKETVLRTVDTLRAMGTRRITLEGGEPLVRPDIVELVDYIHGKGIEMALCTNAVLLAKYLDALQDKIDLFVLSLDGRQEYNDWLRGNGTYEKVIEALGLLAERGIRPLLFCCLVDDNLGDVDLMVSVARQYGAYVTFNVAVGQAGEGARVPLAKRTDEAYRDAIRRILEHKRDGAPIYYSRNTYEQALHWPSFAIESYDAASLAQVCASERRHFVRCVAGRFWCYIECNGDVYPCYQLVNTLPVKNIERDGMRAAFAHLASLRFCCRCYNMTLSELNLQAQLNPRAVLRVVKNYFLHKP